MYLYIFEDGSMTQTSSRPTDDDQDAIDAGILQIMFCRDSRFYYHGNENVLVEMREANDD